MPFLALLTVHCLIATRTLSLRTVRGLNGPPVTEIMGVLLLNEYNIDTRPVQNDWDSDLSHSFSRLLGLESAFLDRQGGVQKPGPLLETSGGGVGRGRFRKRDEFGRSPDRTLFGMGLLQCSIND